MSCIKTYFGKLDFKLFFSWNIFVSLCFIILMSNCEVNPVIITDSVSYLTIQSDWVSGRTIF